MVRELWRRPSIVVVSWCVIVLTIFVVSGDLRIESKTLSPLATSASVAQPLVVRPERPSRAPAAGTVTRTGRVFDALGYLVVGAEVIAMDRAPLRTNADGEFRLAIPEDRITNVLVRASGQRPVWLRANAASPDALVVQLSPAAPWDREADREPSPLPAALAAPLRGEGLVRTADGTPVAGAYVTAVGTEFWSRTDEIGRYVLPLSSATATLQVHLPDGGPDQRGLAARLDVDLGRGQGVVPLPELVADPASAIRGTVRDSRGSPVAGVPVAVRGEGQVRVIDAGPGGIFRLGGLLPGRYQVRALAFRGAIGDVQEITLGACNVVDCDLQLKLLAADERGLRVLDERGSPVGGVYVAASVGGHCCGIAQADANGWAAVPVAVETHFDVRTPQDYTPVLVRRFEAAPATLIVALP